MSMRGDEDYKPKKYSIKKEQRPLETRSKRVTRSTKSYKEETLILTSEDESDNTKIEGESIEGLEDLDRYRLERETSSEVSVKSELWSLGTVEKRTDSLIQGIQQLKEQFGQERMAKREETSMAGVFQKMMEMQLQSEEKRIARELQNEENRLAREEERRVEEARREERREQRELELKEERDRREAKLLLALKEAQPTVPQTIHLENTRLPKMTDGEDVASFIELFEAAMEDNRIPPGQWKAKVHAALDSKTKLKVRDTITNTDSTYNELKEALVGCGDLSFSHASESFMTGDRGETLTLPVRQAILKWQRFLEKITSEATTVREACTYIAVAVARYNMNQDLKTYLDMKGDFSKDLFCRNVDEWMATRPAGVAWAKKKDSYLGNQDRQYMGRQGQRTGQGKRVGDCYFCGKPGHFAQECRARLSREKQTPPGNNPPVPVVKKEQPITTQQTRNMTEVTCFRCRQKGHISPDCPKRTNRVKRVKITKDMIVSLRRNEVFGSVGPHRMPVTCDTGAEVTVVPAEAVELHQRTGELCELKAFNDSKATGEYCNVTITVGETKFEKKAVTQPGADLGWSVCLSLDMADPRESQFLLNEMRRRAAMTREETMYVPPEVRGGVLVSGILVEEAQVVKDKSIRAVSASEPEQESDSVPQSREEGEVVKDEDSDTTAQVSVQATVVEAPVAVEKTSDKGDEKKDDGGVLEKEDILVLEEAEGDALGGRASERGTKELSVEGITSEMPRAELAEATKADVSLQPLYKLGLGDREGYHIVEGLLMRTRLDSFGDTVQQLCIPSGFRDKCLQRAHSGFGHQGRNKMALLLKPYFYWPSMNKDCQRYIKACEICQRTDKAKPKHNPMVERQVVTQPWQDLAIDIVGPFPAAVGGFKYLLTCIDNATRWPEAIPVRSTTAKKIIAALTSIFVRCGFPVRITTDNGTQFVGKIFTKWLREKGIKHVKTTPYHPQGNGVIERLHRTLTAMVTKTAELKGNWAKVVPMALYFIRCTPSAATGISPFLATHGWEPQTPLQVLYQSWVDSELGPIDLSEWVDINSDRLEQARDVATSSKVEASHNRARVWNRKARERKFRVGDKVLIRKPGLDTKLRESWEGPGTVLAVNSPLSYKIQTDKRVMGTVNIQQLKEFIEAKAVKRVTSVLEQDTEEDDVTNRFAEAKVEPQELTEPQQRQLDQLLSKHRKVLDKEPGLTKMVDFDIDTGEAEPVYQRPYNTPIALRKSVDLEIDWLLERGFIRPSSSPWASPMVTVRKADGSARLCVDFRKVNGLTRQTPFYMPRVEEVLEGVGQAKYISKLDLSKGYYQVQLTEQAIPRTAFTSHRGTYEFTRMPFGVKNAPAAFQSLMQRVLTDQTSWATAYMDDIVVYSSTWTGHIQHIDRVLTALQQAGLTANPSKCRWGGRSVEFLGHKIGTGRMSIPEHRVTALTTYTRPATRKGLRAFLGSIGFYRRYVQKLADQTAVLTPLTTKQAPQRVEWTTEGECAFRTICDHFCSVGQLHIPLTEDRLSIVTDASGRGIGGVLQVLRGDEWLPAAYFSRQLRGAEHRYSATELEALALTETVNHFSYYLYGREFQAFTDHKPLEQLLTSPRLNPRLQRMSYKLQQWLMEIRYIPGAQNTLADALSREERPRNTAEEDIIPTDRMATTRSIHLASGDVEGTPPH